MDVRKYRQATISATKWLLSQQDDAGSFRPVERGVAVYHKLPMALAAMGQIERAARLCAWIQANAMDADGDFTGHFPRSGLHERYYIVANSWLVCGAQRLGQFGISVPAAGFVATLQHPHTGGFLSIGPAASLNDEQDLLTTAMGGLAMLHAGNLEAASAAARFLLWLWDHQPVGSTAHLFTAVRDSVKLITNIPASLLRFYLVDATKEGQAYHCPALAAGFLGLLHEATGDAALLEGAKRYMQFIDNCAADRFTSEKSAFVGWAAAILYGVTGNANFQRTASAVADALLEMQLANGSWLQLSMGEDEESDVVDATAEGLIVLTQVLQAFSTGL